MTDIVNRLRFIHRKVDTSGTWLDADAAGPIMHEAAAEIERLRGIIGEVECELNVATGGTYLPHRFAAEVLHRDSPPKE